MPVYEWQCPICAELFEQIMTVGEYAARSHNWTCTCDGIPHRMNRRFSFSPIPPFTPHHNASTGQWVNNMAELKSQMARASDAATARTGIPHNFQPTETGDLTPPTLLN